LVEINGRPDACLRCGGLFKIAGPLSDALRTRLAVLMDEGQGITAIRIIREETGAGLRDAKATYEHLTLEAGRCQWCKSVIPTADYVDCPNCRALNINVR
jgi:hypothetical protein